MNDDKPEMLLDSILPKQDSKVLTRLSGTHLGQTLNSVSSVAPLFEQTSILSLEDKFRDLRDSELHVFANDDQPIGPRIGIQAVAEPTLKALANFEKERRSRIGERTWFIIGSIALAAISAYLGWLFK